MRAESLREVALRTGGDGDWEHHLVEFLDRFYGRDGDRVRQSALIGDDPGLLGLDTVDAVLGGVGEHLARRWALPIPPWVRQAERYLGRGLFWPDEPGLRPYLFRVSPVAFRSRLIFTGPEPLQRARFPYRHGVRRAPWQGQADGPPTRAPGSQPTPAAPAAPGGCGTTAGAVH